MNNLIPLGSGQLAGEPAQTVNARNLHAFLEVRRDFSNWIKDRIAEYGFQENQDFVCSPNLASKHGRGGHNRIDYHLSLDMAKELSMVEKTPKGREARRYFIECERLAKRAVAGGAAKPQPKPSAGPYQNYFNLPPDTPHPLELQKRLAETEAALDRSRKQAGAHLRGLIDSMQAMNASLRDIAANVDELRADRREPRDHFPRPGKMVACESAGALPCRVPRPPVIKTQAQQDLLAYFQKHGSHVSTYRTISAETGLPWPTVRNVVGKFVEAGILVKSSWSSGSNRALRFIVMR